MKFKQRLGLKLSFLCPAILMGTMVFAQQIPLVYDIENTGASYPKPVLPTITELPVIEPLTDPFMWSDGSGRSTDFSDWSHRRAEIKAELEHYEVGIKPGRPDSITASYANGTLTVNVTVNGNTLTLTSPVTLPEGEGPFPAVIGMGGGTGSLPGELFTSRKVAVIGFNFGQVMAHTQARGNEPINKLYPEFTYMGAYSAWPWGVSRIIDGLELVQDVLPIDLKHLAVTGCSFAGKMALWAGAFDERIALTIPQEPGGGGAAAWRVSETLGPVENLGSTSGAWFISDMFKFAGANVSKLPHDHHELIAMIAPRAVLVIGNPDMVWLAEESGYVSCKAAQRVWETFGIGDRFGFSFVAGHGHCALPTSQYPEVEAFIEKFLLGDTTVNTHVEISPFASVDHSAWTAWWGTDKPEFGKRDAQGSESVWFEAECATIGKNWKVINYPVAANGGVVAVKKGVANTTEAPSNSDNFMYLPFNVSKDTIINVFARVICATDKGSSIWAKVDDGPFVKISNLKSTTLIWKNIIKKQLAAGEHTVIIAPVEEGVKIDKFCISNSVTLPLLKGETAINQCVTTPTVGINSVKSSNGYSLEQNFPNPFNSKTSISFEIPKDSYISLKVYNMLGSEIAELAGKEYSRGKHTVEYDCRNLSKGVYFYTITANDFTASQKMIISEE